MMPIKRLLFLAILLSLFSCKTTNCVVTNELFITSWEEEPTHKKKIQLYTIDSLNPNRPKKDKVRKAAVFSRDAHSDPNSLYIVLRKGLCPNQTYKLVVNKTLEYYISNIEVETKICYTMLSKIELYFIKSYVVNGKKIDFGNSRHFRIYIDKSLGKPVR